MSVLRFLSAYLFYNYLESLLGRENTYPSKRTGGHDQAESFSKVFGAHKAQATAADPSQFDDIAEKTAKKHGVDSALVKAVMKVESGLNPRAVSHAGAQGLMQLMPQTAQALGVNDAFDPLQNIDGGTRYLKEMLDSFGDTATALAAYNAGPGAVRKHGGIPPYRETQNYVPKVLAEYQRINSRA